MTAVSGWLEFVSQLVVSAGSRLVESLGQVDAMAKGPFDLVTDVDYLVQEMISDEIRAQFPGHQILAEEGYEKGPAAIDEFCWVIDPLDGTLNFTLGIPCVSVSVALLHQGEPLLGCVYDPARGELFEAERGAGSFINGKSLAVQPATSAVLPLGMSSGFLSRIPAGDEVSLLSVIMQRFAKVRILGSQALHLCYVAAGRLRAAISWEARLWDDAAGALIVKEAGGQYTDFAGSEVFPVRTGSRVLTGTAIHSIAALEPTHSVLVSLLGDLHGGSTPAEEMVA